MEYEIQQKGDQEKEEKALKTDLTEEKLANTLPELETVSEHVKDDKDLKREFGIVLNDENNEDIDTVIDDYDNNKENDPEFSSSVNDNKINIKGSVEKQVFELDDNNQVKMTSNTTLTLTGSKENITENITIDNVSILKTTNVDNKTVETIKIEETIVDSPSEKTTFESISKVERHDKEITSLETDKMIVQNLETNEIVTDTVTTKKEITEISPDQTLIETRVFKENNDKISKGSNVRSIEVKEIVEDNVKDQKNVESLIKQETTTETPFDKTTLTVIANDNSTINKKVADVELDKENSVIASNQNKKSDHKPRINVITVTEVREEKQSEDDYEESETPTPATPEDEEDFIGTISKVAPELVSVIRDLKQVSDQLDPIKRSWNDLKLRANSEHETEIDKAEKEKLVKKAINSIKKAMIEEATDQETDQEEGKVSLSDVQVQTLIQPTSPSFMFDDVIKSMVTPGFNNNVVLAMNICFWLLFATLIFVAILSDYNSMVLLNIGTSVLLYLALHWFIVVTRAEQLEESVKEKKD